MIWLLLSFVNESKIPDFGNMPQLLENMIAQHLSFDACSVMTGRKK